MLVRLNLQEEFTLSSGRYYDIKKVFFLDGKRPLLVWCLNGFVFFKKLMAYS